MIPILPAALGSALAVSLLVNVIQYRAIGSLNEDAGKLRQQRDTASIAAQRCSESLTELTTKATKQAQETAKEVADALARAKAAERRARAILTAPQAVPGDACASAQLENRRWLENRRAAK